MWNCQQNYGKRIAEPLIIDLWNYLPGQVEHMTSPEVGANTPPAEQDIDAPISADSQAPTGEAGGELPTAPPAVILPPPPTQEANPTPRRRHKRKRLRIIVRYAPEELRVRLLGIQDSEHRAYFSIVYLFALRGSEAIGITQKNIYTATDRNGNAWVFATVRTLKNPNQPERTVPILITPEETPLIDFILAWKASRPPGRLFTKSGRWFRKLALRYFDTRRHDLRHNRALHLKERLGMDGLQALLGHASATSTQVYASMDMLDVRRKQLEYLKLSAMPGQAPASASIPASEPAPEPKPEEKTEQKPEEKKNAEG